MWGELDFVAIVDGVYYPGIGPYICPFLGEIHESPPTLEDAEMKWAPLMMGSQCWSLLGGWLPSILVVWLLRPLDAEPCIDLRVVYSSSCAVSATNSLLTSLTSSACYSAWFNSSVLFSVVAAARRLQRKCDLAIISQLETFPWSLSWHWWANRSEALNGRASILDLVLVDDQQRPLDSPS